MSCNQTKSLMSLYLDGRVTGRQMQSVAAHLATCRQCHGQFCTLRSTQQLMGAMGRRQPPPELALRIRSAISREAARTPRRRFEGFLVRLEDALNSFMVPATAGVLSAVIFFGLLMGYFFVPTQLQAANDMVPTALYTPAELKSSPFDITMTNTPGSVTVEAVIDPNGRVVDYRVISPNDDEAQAATLRVLKNMLIFTEFRPATAFGQPINGRVVVSFSNINVKG